jgi:hypothetical protein
MSKVTNHKALGRVNEGTKEGRAVSTRSCHPTIKHSLITVKYSLGTQLFSRTGSASDRWADLDNPENPLSHLSSGEP